MPIPYTQVPWTLLDNTLFAEKNIEVSLLRLDALHPIVSGNKWFKLYFFLEACKEQKLGLATYGGAYSNHLAATAFAAFEAGIACKGFIRGEKPKALNPTLLHCLKYKMDIEFIPREEYEKLKYGDAILDKYLTVPEGGYHPIGKKGASIISTYFNQNKYTHVVVPIGSATTFAGLIDSLNQPLVIGVAAIKNMLDIEERLRFLNCTEKKYDCWHHYHFGGFAKSTNTLIDFMNEFYMRYSIPLDFVYTAKMMYGVFDQITNNYFNPGDKILCIHTGGLQGNDSIRNLLFF